jgi:hypothetical protein
MLYLVSVENMDLGDGFETAFSGFRWFRAVFGGLQKPMVVIIPKSKDQFMERPPMKTV